MEKENAPLLEKLTGKKILIVEDDLITQMYLENLLNNKNIDILLANDGEQALEQVKKNDNIAIVLLDLDMPKMNGLETISKIIKINPKVKIVIETVHSKREKMEHCMKLGASAYLTKPLENDELLETINSVI